MICWFLIEKEIYLHTLPVELRVDRTPLCSRVELYHLNSTNFGHVADRNKACVYFPCMLSMKKDMLKQTSTANSISDIRFWPAWISGGNVCKYYSKGQGWEENINKSP